MLNSGKLEKSKSLKSSPKSQNKKVVPPKPTGQVQNKGPFIDELNAYMPLRGEFETEWDNECETYIQDITFEDGETEEEVEAKLSLLECYNERLEIRYKTREFVVEKRLHDSPYLSKLEKARTPEQSNIYQQYKRYVQFMTLEEYESFVQGAANQKKLEQRVQKLQGYRMKGICSLLEARHYEQELAVREKDKNKAKLGRKKTSHHRRSAEPLNLEGQPGFQLLSAQEQGLCKNYHIIPQQYMLIKQALLKEYLKAGDLTRATATQLLNIETEKAGKIFDFLQEAGWINNRFHMS